MQSSTKFLLGIVIGIVLLVIVTFTVVMMRPEPTYQDDTTPEGAAHNYLLAIQNGDYERAYSYIPEAYQFPENADQMGYDIEQRTWQFDTGSDISLSVESSRMRGDEKAAVTIRKTTFHNSGLMGSSQSTRTFTLDMVLEDGVWKVSDGENFWYSNCWGISRNERCR